MTVPLTSKTPMRVDLSLAWATTRIPVALACGSVKITLTKKLLI